MSKAFPGVLALDDVSFTVKSGSVHALCGENGAGKSTLLKILSGVYKPDSGNLLFGDQPFEFDSPMAALEAKVAVIYQELHLAPELTVAESIFLGHLPARFGWIDRKELESKARASLRLVGIDIEPNAQVGSLSIANRQMVEIAKALSRNAEILAFDEPTSSLSTREVDSLFTIIEDLKNQGKAILYVTHRMDEIFRICDAATVLRDGKHVETFTDLNGIGPDDLVNRMVGRSIEDVYGYVPRSSGEVVLYAENMFGPGLSQPTSIQVRAGEIVGLFGLVGAGRTELLRAIFDGKNGQVTVSGRIRRPGEPRHSIELGMMLCPEDRKRQGIVAMSSVKENINLSVRRQKSKLGFLIDEREEDRNATAQIDRLGIRTPGLNQPIGLLSGGNQQKCVLARWLSEDVRVLLLDEPTRGVDVGAKREIYDIAFELAASGAGILVVSSDLSEVLGISDRILVMRQGQIVADLPRDKADSETVMKLALPVSDQVAVSMV